ncbi:MAG TPA: SRPBCC domain-containing protein [Acidimicrobiales bacterium]|nr:SRPBCC domain-containing protein [Acidimicrobiales bacterium]
MGLSLLRRKKDIVLERTYAHPASAVWRAWTEAELLRQWWGPDKTTVPECRVDARVGGELYIVMEAGPEMGRYAGTRWPMAGTFTAVEPTTRLTYDARSWTEGQEDTTTIEHVNDVTFAERDGATTVVLKVSIDKIGPKAKMAAFGMRWGYKAQLDKLEQLLAR